MDRTIYAYFHRLIVCLLLGLSGLAVQADEKDALDRKVHLVKNKGTVYELLKQISDQTGYLFIYDSQLIENDRVVKIAKGEYTLREAIYRITGNNRLQIDLLDEHLLLRQADKQNDVNRTVVNVKQHTPLTISGSLYDKETEMPIPFASVSVLHTSIGTVTNQDGEYQLLAPDSLHNSNVRFSHIGYESQEIALDLLQGQHIRIALKPQVISLQEVVVRAISPMKVLGDMLNHRSVNYASDPVYLTTFYREGIHNKGKNIDLTESVLQVYKTGYQHSPSFDQVKLIKKRRIINRQETDTIFPRMRSGINSCLVLDIIKELPEFLDPGEGASYLYAHTGMNAIDNRLVDVIYFKQKEYVKEPLYTGELYVEAENKALVEVRFELNPQLVNKATNMFIDRKAANLKINLVEAKYLVSYKPADNGIYYVNHIRGDISFKVRLKRRMFSMPLHFWFEMVTCKIDTEQVHPFPRNERLPTNRVFSETKHGYDQKFWENFNVILPEEELQDAILHSLNEVLISE